jgi:pimeloyl-ACP methyl ester carboxylesterase/acyl carrier protein
MVRKGQKKTHTEAAAGIAGLIKVVLALKHQLIPSHLHFTRLNPHIDFGKCDVQIPTKSLPWPTFDESPRRGAVSSFGFSGTNAHVVIEEGPGCVLSAQQAKPYYLLALSAKHPDSLKQRLEDLHGHLKDHADLPLEAIAYTLNVGRNHFDYRCAFVVSSIEELQDALEEIKQGKKPNHYLIAKDKISTEQEPIFEEILGRVLEELPEKKSEPSTYYKKLLSLADLYIKGYNIDWEVLHQREAKQRISLPTYPFLKKSYWINQKEIKGGIETISRTTSLHPLLDANVSTLEAQCFTKVFTEQEFYLADHQVNNDILLPGAVYLEMARAAGELALPHQSILGFSNIGWLRPLKVDHKPQMAKIKIYSLDSEVRFEVITEPREDSGDSSKSVIHAQGTIRYAAKGQTSPELIRLDVEGIKAGCSKKQSKDNIYAVLKSKGLVYGAGFQTIEELWYNDTETLAKLCLPPHLDHNQQWGLHPSLMEGALQASMNFIGEKSTSPYLLFSVEDLDIYMKVPGTHTSYYAYLQKEEHNRFHVALLDEKGLVCFKLRNVMVQPLEATPSVQVSETATLIYTIKKIITESLKIDISILEESNNIGDIGIDSIVFMEILKNIKKELNLDNIFLSEFAGINTISSLINFVVNKYNKTQTQTYSETNPVMIKNEGIKDDTISKYRKVFLNYDQIKTSVLKTSNNMNIEVIKAGSGYPLVLLPPLDSISTAWRYQILEFSKSYEVISLHYPGYGRSSYRRDLANLDQISDDIMEILDKLGINSSINLVGWSLGGLISQILAAKYPDMLNTLSLVNTTFKLEEDNELENIYNLMKMLREDFESNSYRLKDKSNKDTITINHLRDLRPHEVSMQYFKNVFEFDSREKLSLIKTPTLIISGVDDKATPPKYAEYINTCIKNSQHHSLKGGGHYIPLFNSQYFNEMLSKFLTTHTIRLERNAGDHARQAKDIPALGF